VPAGDLAGIQHDRENLALIDADLHPAPNQARTERVVVGVYAQERLLARSASAAGDRRLFARALQGGSAGEDDVGPSTHPDLVGLGGDVDAPASSHCGALRGDVGR
jgi:hypothetical protein